MKEINEKTVKENLRESISEYCRWREQQGLCEPDGCVFCPVNDVFDMARDNTRFEQYFSGEPVENPISYQEFMDQYENEMLCLDCYDQNGVEIADTTEIQPDTKVIKFSRQSGSFDVVLDM